ncbi:NADH-ubiquinone oxidoreductase B18 subunit [Ancylostoma caninum]|uniref:NADH dehydrogenase [ubiquinone] 1 beta subcomplex subunit 7 n=1 Tax=Ancylostoma caninum TaxID=29170 RepID=A0A368FL35_ANCCA|nr:NADH-ubiquinone oxidoreductase B18 subunit [Ancylostoma caninum]
MGTKLSVSIEGTTQPEIAPRVDRPPTFDPQAGFEKPRKPREMKVSWEEMDQYKLKPGQRDYCAHLLIPLIKCQRANAPFAGHLCDSERSAWDKCEYDDYIMRIKEFERERRLLMRKHVKKQWLPLNVLFWIRIGVEKLAVC